MNTSAQIYAVPHVGQHNTGDEIGGVLPCTFQAGQNQTRPAGVHSIHDHTPQVHESSTG